MGALESVLLLLGLVGGDGALVGLLVGFGVGRYSRHPRSGGWIAAALLATTIVCIGGWAATTIRTEPRNAADARAHDYSLAGLWIALVVWLTVINAVGAVAGVKAGVWEAKRRRRAAAGVAAVPEADVP